MDSKNFVFLYTVSEEYKDKIDKITTDFKISKIDFWKMYESESDYREEINRIKGLYCARKDEEGKTFGFNNFEVFYNWYKDNSKKCHYCETNADDIKELFKTGKIKTSSKRGKNLEIDRKEPGKNVPYTPENCVLACYICNNAKSDLMNDKLFKETIAKGIKEFYKQKLIENNIINK